MEIKNHSSDSLARWLSSLAVVGAAYVVCFFLLESSTLPDYEAYERIFNQPDAYRTWNFLFSSLFGFTLLFMGYDTLRAFFLIIGAAFCVFSMSRIRHSSLTYFLLFPIIVIFLLEFFQVRLRAGLSIIFFYTAFFVGFTIKKRVISVPLVALSMAIHPATGGTLLLCSGVFVRFFRFWFVRFVLLAFGWVALLLIIDYLSADRGVHLFSEINTVRLFAICVGPVICLLVLRRFKLGYLVDPRFSGIGAVFFCGLATSALYFIGFFSLSGEAIVRVLSLVTGVSLLVSMLTVRLTKLMRGLALATLIINDLFFVNTLYL